MFTNTADYQIAFIKLVSYMQNIGELSSDDKIYAEIADICDYTEEEIREALD